ncbi:MAG: M48 family metallopeptidase, partial [Thermoguttaceae bacterium]
FCRNQDRSLTIFSEDRKFPAALQQASAGLLDEQLGQQLRRRRSESRWARIVTATILATIVLLLVGGYYAVRAGARAAALAVPVSVDREIGQMAMKSMDLGGPEITDPVVVAAVQSMVDRLAPHADGTGMAFEIHVIDSPTVNAFALPGGQMVVFTGLIAEADEPEQLAGVLAHEMAHATLRHGLTRIGQSLGFSAALHLLLGDAEGLVAAGAELFQLASINSYSREQEMAADLEGSRMLHAAAIDPAALARFLQVLQQQGDLPGVVSWIGTHPQHQERIAAIQQHLAAMPKQDYRPVEVDWAEVQKKVNPE